MNINKVKNDSSYERVSNQSKNLNTEADFQKALDEFKDFVEDRIENGPPKFQIGGTEYSVDEWQKLMDSVDKDIENVKEEQKERFEKLEEERRNKEDLEKIDVNPDAPGIQRVTDEDINKII